MRISHEAIYQALYVQGRGALCRELVACLRTGVAESCPLQTYRDDASYTSLVSDLAGWPPIRR